MAYSENYMHSDREVGRKVFTVTNNPGVVVRIKKEAPRKDLLSVDVCIEDTTEFSTYYFNVIRKPSELKIGGNIFEFAPPRNRFKLDSEIQFEVVDSQNNPLAYEILPKKPGYESIRICIFLYDYNIEGPCAISLNANIKGAPTNLIV